MYQLPRVSVRLRSKIPLERKCSYGDQPRVLGPPSERVASGFGALLCGPLAKKSFFLKFIRILYSCR